MQSEFREYEKGFGKRRFNRLLGLIRRNRVLPIRPGWEQTPNGIVPPPVAEPVSAGFQYWKYSNDDGEITILDPATILRDIADLTETVTISNVGTALNPSAGDVVSLKFVDQDPTTCTLESESTWTDYPSAYTIDGTGGDAEFTAYRFPLFHVSGSEGSGYSRLADNLYIKRLAIDTPLRVVNTVYRQDNTYPVLAVPVLEPYHEALPAD